MGIEWARTHLLRQGSSITARQSSDALVSEQKHAVLACRDLRFVQENALPADKMARLLRGERWCVQCLRRLRAWLRILAGPAC